MFPTVFIVRTAINYDTELHSTKIHFLLPKTTCILFNPCTNALYNILCLNIKEMIKLKKYLL